MAAKNAAKAEEDYLDMWVNDNRRGQIISEGRGGSGTSRTRNILGGSGQTQRPNFLRRG